MSTSLFHFFSEVLLITKATWPSISKMVMYFVVRETQITTLPSNTEICLKEEMDLRDRLNKNYSKVCEIHVEIWSLEIV